MQNELAHVITERDRHIERYFTKNTLITDVFLCLQFEIYSPTKWLRNSLVIGSRTFITTMKTLELSWLSLWGLESVISDWHGDNLITRNTSMVNITPLRINVFFTLVAQGFCLHAYHIIHSATISWQIHHHETETYKWSQQDQQRSFTSILW